jgi:SH3-like domain-containing protein
VDVFDLTDTNRVMAQLQPGVWYVLLDRQGAWSRVADQGHNFEGWVASDSVRLRDG